MTTEKVLAHHLESFGKGDVDEIMADYTDESVLYTPDGPLKGLAEIRPLFEKLTGEILPLGTDFKMLQQQIKDDVAYIAWTAESEKYKFPIGTDTFIIKNGKILIQTYAGHMVEK